METEAHNHLTERASERETLPACLPANDRQTEEERNESKKLGGKSENEL